MKENVMLSYILGQNDAHGHVSRHHEFAPEFDVLLYDIAQC